MYVYLYKEYDKGIRTTSVDHTHVSFLSYLFWNNKLDRTGFYINNGKLTQNQIKCLCSLDYFDWNSQEYANAHFNISSLSLPLSLSISICLLHTLPQFTELRIPCGSNIVFRTKMRIHRTTTTTTIYCSSN